MGLSLVRRLAYSFGFVKWGPQGQTCGEGIDGGRGSCQAMASLLKAILPLTPSPLPGRERKVTLHFEVALKRQSSSFMTYAATAQRE
jgi:hypothetical protein